MILAVGQNLAWQKLCFLPSLRRGEVNRVAEVATFASSKGPNVMRALVALGGRGQIVGYAGGETGRCAVKQLSDEGIDFVPVWIGGETRICTTYIEPDGTCTELIEPPPRVTSEESARFHAVVVDRLVDARVVVIAGTALAGENEDCYARIARQAHESHLPVLMDSVSPEARRALVESPEAVKINSEELGVLSGRDVRDQPARSAACAELMTRFGIRWILVTRGREGIEAYSARGGLHARPPAVKVVNAIGSGDAATGGLAWVLHEAGSSAFDSPEALRDALLTTTAMGTANCLNRTNGRVEPSDYRDVRKSTVITELPPA